MGVTCGASLFGSNNNQFIKTNGGDFIAVDGSGTRERLILSDLRIPYKQILKSRIILKVGQTNYLLNFLGLGDNATFLCMRARYDSKSVIEADNYINWSYADDLTRVNYFADMMVLTGNSTNRVPQLYLTNPSTKYAVSIDIMVGIIDDSYSIFTDTLNQSGTSFVNLEYTDIHSHIIGESIVINDKSSPVKPLIYIRLSDINSIERSGQILIIDDSSLGIIFLQFLTLNDTYQAHSLLNYVLQHPNTNIDTLQPTVADYADPVLYFYGNVGNTASGDYITFSGATTSIPYNTSQGFTFSTSISLGTFGTGSTGGSASAYLDKSQLIYLLVDHITDNRDGSMYMLPSNIIISGTGGSVSNIAAAGTYSLAFDFSDIAHNYLDGVIVNLNITA
jgi:hypothetical protein